MGFGCIKMKRSYLIYTEEMPPKKMIPRRVWECLKVRNDLPFEMSQVNEIDETHVFKAIYEEGEERFYWMEEKALEGSKYPATIICMGKSYDNDQRCNIIGIYSRCPICNRAVWYTGKLDGLKTKFFNGGEFKCVNCKFGQWLEIAGEKHYTLSERINMCDETFCME